MPSVPSVLLPCLDSQAAPWLLLLALLIGHFLCDYPLQGAFLARAKNRNLPPDPEVGELSRWIWVHALTAHSFIHGGAVWLITGCAWFAIAEIVLHWCIDFAKCEGWVSYTTDQILHATCKAVYVGILWWGLQ